jgi:hypothetical protein
LDNERAIEEQMRFRDLVLQVERFLKYGTKGTAPDVVRREARSFSERLNVFQDGFDQSKIKKLKAKLAKMYSSGDNSH